MGLMATHATSIRFVNRPVCPHLINFTVRGGGIAQETQAAVCGGTVLETSNVAAIVFFYLSLFLRLCLVEINFFLLFM
jgi:hypothetical protein